MIKLSDENTAQRAGLGYTISNIILKGIIFLSLPVFSRLLSPSDFGIYNNYLAYEGIISGIMSLGLYSCIKKAVFDFKDNFNSFFSSILSSIIFTYILTIILSFIFKHQIFKYTGFNEYIIIILLSQSFGSAIIQLYASKLNVEFKYKEYLIISALNSITNIVLSICLIFLLSYQPWISRIIGTATPYIIIGIYLVTKCYIKGRVFLKKEYVFYSLKIGLPLIPHVLSQYILNQSDRIMISKFIGDSESGIYSFAYNVCTILYIVLMSIESAWTPWTYNCYENHKNENVKKASNRLMILSVCLFIGFVSICPEVYKILGDEKYYPGIKMIIPLSLSMFLFFLYSFPVGIEYYHKKTLFVSIATCVAAMLNILLNFILIPKYGYYVSAFTTLISYVIMFLIHLAISMKFNIKQNYNLTTMSFIIFISFLYSLLLFFVEDYFVLSIIVRYGITVLDVGFMLYFFKNDIQSLRRKMK